MQAVALSLMIDDDEAQFGLKKAKSLCTGGEESERRERERERERKREREKGGRGRERESASSAKK
jgi:hypothetical protein